MRDRHELALHGRTAAGVLAGERRRADRDLRGVRVVGERAAELRALRVEGPRGRVDGVRLADVDLGGLEAVLAAVRAVPDAYARDLRHPADVDLPPHRANQALNTV